MNLAFSDFRLSPKKERAEFLILDLDAPRSNDGGPSVWVIGAWTDGLLGLKICSHGNPAYRLNKNAVADYAKTKVDQHFATREIVWIAEARLVMPCLLVQSAAKQRITLKNGTSISGSSLHSSKAVTRIIRLNEKNLRWRPLPTDAPHEFYVFRFNMKEKLNVIVYGENLPNAIRLLRKNRLKTFCRYICAFTYGQRVIEHHTETFKVLCSAICHSLDPEAAAVLYSEKTKGDNQNA